MSNQLKYMPILRGRAQEMMVLKSFEFEECIYPCLEIIKELDQSKHAGNKFVVSL